MVKLMLQMLEEKKVTTKTQRVWVSSISFYLTVRALKIMGLVKEYECNGNKKSWGLTEEGKEVAGYYKKIEEVLKRCEEKRNLGQK